MFHFVLYYCIYMNDLRYFNGVVFNSEFPTYESVCDCMQENAH